MNEEVFCYIKVLSVKKRDSPSTVLLPHPHPYRGLKPIFVVLVNFKKISLYQIMKNHSSIVKRFRTVVLRSYSISESRG